MAVNIYFGWDAKCSMYMSFVQVKRHLLDRFLHNFNFPDPFQNVKIVEKCSHANGELLPLVTLPSNLVYSFTPFRWLVRCFNSSRIRHCATFR